MKKIALISVSNKNHIVEFAKFLEKNDYQIVSTSGTFKLLEKNNVNVIQVSEITKSKEILDGRVKTLHPNIHGAILADLSKKSHIKELEEQEITKIDLVVVNLYNFKEQLKVKNSKEADLIEKIDIGGPTMIRSAAKNFKHTTVVCDPSDYQIVQEEIKKNKVVSIETKKHLASKAFAHTAHYDACINEWFKSELNIDWYENDSIALLNKQELRYGENPHQKGMYFNKLFTNKNSLLNAKQLHGKALSYNNIIDANAAINIMAEFNEKPTALSLKHTNSCGLAQADSIDHAWDLCYEGDKISIFGGIICLNREVNASIAEKMSKIFLEIIIAPKFSKEGFKILSKKKNIRLLQLNLEQNEYDNWNIRSISGGFTIQQYDHTNWDEEFKNLECVTKAKYNKIEDIKFAWKTVKHLKSNAISITTGKQLVGIGVGQPNRVQSVRIAMNQNPGLIDKSILASDAFFPMKDSIDEIAKADIKAIVQPGGSIRDKEVIEQCNKYGIAMYFTKKRHFLH